MRITERKDSIKCILARYHLKASECNFIKYDINMEMHTIINDIINNENDCETNKESANELKSKLRKQIENLKFLIYQTECNLGISKFSNTECCIVESEVSNPVSPKKILNIDAQLESALYKYSSFYCVKYTKQECVFNFSSLNKCDKKNTFAVQILMNKEKITLGKWLMPMPIDLIDLMLELSIKELKDLPYFFKTCKHYNDCYFMRHEQFVALMDIVSDTKNCNLQANLQYTQINLELMRVYDKINDKYIDIIIYLLYNFNEIRPYKIKVDSMSKETLDPKTIKHLKVTLACFKQFHLYKAFKKILNKGAFIWSKEEDEDSPLEMNNSDCSDNDGLLGEYLLSEQKSLELSKRRRKVRKKQNTIKRQKIDDVLNLPSTSKDTRHSRSFQDKNKEKEQEFENRKQHSESENDSDITESTPLVNKSNQKKPRQRKLEFHKNKSNLHVKNDDVSSKITSFKKKTVYKKQNQPFTSTPKHEKKQDSKLIISSNTDISDITINAK
ncbi:uncharacterized protein LOC117607641 isoform X1 [Osmia lignaria lignaria]|uniref:uncharacterized protein LOC117607641 isoform X1 n=1 Tax=Osmia lignaria lignaria TaxID=1437193 RepID=UPI00402B3EA1